MRSYAPAAKIVLKNELINVWLHGYMPTIKCCMWRFFALHKANYKEVKCAASNLEWFMHFCLRLQP